MFLHPQGFKGEMEGKKKIKDQLAEQENIFLFKCCFVFSSGSLENTHQILFLYFPILHMHFHSQVEVKKLLWFLHFAVSMGKTIPKSKVPSNWHEINGWQSCRGWFPCQGIGTSFGKAVLKNTIHTRFLSDCWLQSAKLLLVQFKRSGVRSCEFCISWKLVFVAEQCFIMRTV